MARGRRPLIPDDVVKALFAQGKSDTEIASGFAGATADYVRVRRIKNRLLRREAPAKREPTQSRRGSHTVNHRPFTMPPVNNPAFDEARTIYPRTVVDVAGLQNLLISGVNSKKIGAVITKGPAKGFPIFTLTLEERATCPTSCDSWRSCYGNQMNWAKRVRHGAAFEERLAAELAVLQSRHPRGFAVRLHVLGDFYSVEYVRLWESFLARFRSMFVFGFTARWRRDDPIALALLDLVVREWGRFSIRFSNAPVDECSTVSIEHPVQKPDDAVLCPAQVGKTESCGTCGFCWNSRRRVAFLQH
jgi:hypothetical protein